jgi:hypothetical protein
MNAEEAGQLAEQAAERAAAVTQAQEMLPLVEADLANAIALPRGNTSTPGDAVYTDGAHLVCRDEDALHAFARRIGLRRRWFQNRGRHPHYDLTTAHMAVKAQDAGAVRVNSRRLIEMLRGETDGSD